MRTIPKFLFFLFSALIMWSSPAQAGQPQSVHFAFAIPPDTTVFEMGTLVARTTIRKTFSFDRDTIESRLKRSISDSDIQAKIAQNEAFHLINTKGAPSSNGEAIAFYDSVHREFIITIEFAPLKEGILSTPILIRVLPSQTKDIDTLVMGKIQGKGIYLHSLPSLVNFGTLNPGQQPVVKQAKIINDGDTDVSVHCVLEPQQNSHFRFVTTETSSLSLKSDFLLEGFIRAHDSAVISIEFSSFQDFNIHTTATVTFGVLNGNNEIFLEGIGHISLQGSTGTKPVDSIQVSTSSLDFGKVLVGTTRTLSVSIKNVKQEPTSVILTMENGQNAKNIFFPTSLTLQANELKNIEVSFIPQTTGSISAVLHLKGGTAQQIPLAVRGQGILPPKQISFTGSTEATIGQQIPLHLHVSREAAGLLINSNVTHVGFAMWLRYNRSVLAPDLSGLHVQEDSPGFRTMEINGFMEYQDSSGTLYFTNGIDTTKELTMTALLGDTDSAIVELTAMKWLCDTKSTTLTVPVDLDHNIPSTHVKITNVFRWSDGTLRLIESQYGTPDLLLTPNPAPQGMIEVHVTNISNEATLTFFNVSGHALPISFRLQGPAAKQSFTLDNRDHILLKRGMYLCRLTSGRYSLVKKIIVD